MRLAFTLLLLLAACGGGRSQVAIGPAPDRVTNGPLAGPLCEPGVCQCRQGDADAGLPGAGYKRYEVRIGPSPQEAWITMPGRTLYKSKEIAEACFYVDMAPGEHPVTLRTSDPAGVVAVMTVSELGTKTGSWYDTFGFSCGYGGACSFEQLEDVQTEYRAVKRNLHDPCGTTKIKGITWDHGKAPDRSHPNELAVSFVLDIYQFEAWKPHGDTSCGEGGGPPPAGYDQ